MTKTPSKIIMLINPGNKAPNKLRLKADILTRNTGMLRISVQFDRLIGHENVGTSRYFLAKSQNVYIL